MKTRLVKILFVAWSDPAGGKEEQKIAVVRRGPGREHLARINFISAVPSLFSSLIVSLSFSMPVQMQVNARTWNFVLRCATRSATIGLKKKNSFHFDINFTMVVVQNQHQQSVQPIPP